MFFENLMAMWLSVLSEKYFFVTYYENSYTVIIWLCTSIWCIWKIIIFAQFSWKNDVRLFSGSDVIYILRSALPTCYVKFRYFDDLNLIAFCEMVDWRKMFSIISRRDNCQRSSASQISDTSREGIEPE